VRELTDGCGARGRLVLDLDAVEQLLVAEVDHGHCSREEASQLVLAARRSRTDERVLRAALQACSGPSC
jgi:hypothetical protein